MKVESSVVHTDVLYCYTDVGILLQMSFPLKFFFSYVPEFLLEQFIHFIITKVKRIIRLVVRCGYKSDTFSLSGNID